MALQRTAESSIAKPSCAGRISAALALAAAVYRLWDSRNFCLDDAWIHLSYAKSIRLGDGFAYNPGDHETGFSSPLWVLLLAAWPWGADPVQSVKWLGALLHAVLAAGAALLTQRLLHAGATGSPAEPAVAPEWRPLLAGVLVATDPFLTFSAVSGMEVSLTAALLVWTLYGALAEARWLSFGLGALCVWARPECLFVLVAWSVLRWLERRRLTDLLAALGALLALGVWITYLLALTGYPWPNTYYAKRGADLLHGLLYVLAQVLPEQAWAVGVTGVWLLLRGLRRPRALRCLTLAWLAAVLAIAGSRELAFGPAFYNSRYFAILGALPIVASACALPARPWLRALALAPIIAATLWLWPKSVALQRSQEADITTLHVEPARWLAHALPGDARVAVEGAGAVRFYAPRSMHILDVNGLNHAAVVHAPTPQAALCTVLREHPTHVLLPDEHIRGFQQTLHLALLKTFADDDYTLSLVHVARRVYAARVLEASPFGRQLCHLP